jgi:FHA domain
VQIQLSWIDPATGKSQQPMLQVPIALGREFALMPSILEGKRVSRVVLDDDLVSGYHALIDFQDSLIIIDQNSTNGTKINGHQLPNSELRNSDRLQIGNYEISINLTATSSVENSGKCDRMVGFLFKRRCDRTSSLGCTYCENNAPYFYQEYSYYPDYGNYNRGNWGYEYYHDRDCYSYNRDTGNVDFTEADNASLEMEGDEDFELDMGAS